MDDQPLNPQLAHPIVYGALQRAMFRKDPESAHHTVMRLLGIAHRNAAARMFIRGPRPDSRLATNAFGVQFDSPVGLAAGFDKEAQAYNALLALGFSHVELGTVTPKGQPGNDLPRIERHVSHQALINRMGFPGPGMDVIARRLRRVPPIGRIGLNIGPNKETSADRVPGSLSRLAERLAPLADYLAINVSSPNTPGLRALQTPEGVARLVQRTLEGVDGADHDVPVLLKLHPDAADDDLLAVARSAVDAGASGIIATNTTSARLPDMANAMDGGMSGRPLTQRSRAVVSHLHQGLGRDTPIVGVGGIFSADDAWEMIRSGASLVQTYTGFIYEGPKQPTTIQKGLIRRLNEAGLDSIMDAVGTA